MRLPRLLLLAAAGASAFDITDYHIETNGQEKKDTIVVNEGESFTLWCKADNWWEWCNIKHFDKQCQFNYQYSYRLKEKERLDICSTFVDGEQTCKWNCKNATCSNKCTWENGIGNRVSFHIRNLDLVKDGKKIIIWKDDQRAKECGIEVKKVKREDAGDWSCEMLIYQDWADKWEARSRRDYGSPNRTVTVNVMLDNDILWTAESQKEAEEERKAELYPYRAFTREQNMRIFWGLIAFNSLLVAFIMDLIPDLITPIIRMKRWLQGYYKKTQ